MIKRSSTNIFHQSFHWQNEHWLGQIWLCNVAAPENKTQKLQSFLIIDSQTISTHKYTVPHTAWIARYTVPEQDDCQSSLWVIWLVQWQMLFTSPSTEDRSRAEEASKDVKSDRDGKSAAPGLPPEASCSGLILCESMCRGLGLCHTSSSRVVLTPWRWLCQVPTHWCSYRGWHKSQPGLQGLR